TVNYVCVWLMRGKTVQQSIKYLHACYISLSCYRSVSVYVCVCVCVCVWLCVCMCLVLGWLHATHIVCVCGIERVFLMYESVLWVCLVLSACSTFVQTLVCVCVCVCVCVFVCVC